MKRINSHTDHCNARRVAANDWWAYAMPCLDAWSLGPIEVGSISLAEVASQERLPGRYKQWRTPTGEYYYQNVDTTQVTWFPPGPNDLMLVSDALGEPSVSGPTGGLDESVSGMGLPPAARWPASAAELDGVKEFLLGRIAELASQAATAQWVFFYMHVA
jgi:hypothetical protein